MHRWQVETLAEGEALGRRTTWMYFVSHAMSRAYGFVHPGGVVAGLSRRGGEDVGPGPFDDDDVKIPGIRKHGNRQI